MCGPSDIKQGDRQEIGWFEKKKQKKQFKRSQASQRTSEVPLSKDTGVLHGLVGFSCSEAVGAMQTHSLDIAREAR